MPAALIRLCRPPLCIACTLLVLATVCLLPPSAAGAQKSAPAARLGTQKASAVRPGAQKNAPQSLHRFNPKAFGRNATVGSAKSPAQARPGEARNAAEKQSAGSEKLSFDAERKYPSEGIAPRRAALPGGRNTLSHIDGLPPPEVSMRYRMQNGTAARVLVNPQDQNSPIYAPVRPGGNVEGAGVYLDVDVAKNLQLQMGGEYRDLEQGDAGGRSEDSAGASMGFKLSF